MVAVGKNETTPLLPDSLLGRFTKPSESRISETTSRDVMFTGTPYGGAIITDGATSGVRPTFIYRHNSSGYLNSLNMNLGHSVSNQSMLWKLKSCCI